MNSHDLPVETAPASLKGFGRTDLVTALAVCGVLGTLILAALADPRSRSDRMICANNLRQIGIALQVWGNDHDDLTPWNVDLAKGGTRLHPLSGNTWLHFAWLSNELSSARLLLCPSDTGVAAEDFSGDPKHGYLHPNFANRATSYFLNAHPLDASSRAGDETLVGDRNVTPLTPNPTGCSILFGVSTINGCPSFATWGTNMHSREGNLLMFDGRVEQANPQRLRAAFDLGCDDYLSIHLSVPR